MLATRARGLGMLALLVLCLILLYNYEFLVGESKFKTLWSGVRVDDLHNSQASPSQVNAPDEATSAIASASLPISSSKSTPSLGDAAKENAHDPTKAPQPTSATASASLPISSPEPTPSLGDAPKENAHHTAEASQATSQSTPLSPDDIVLIFKTGASTIWRRMPLHLSTTLSNNRVPNSVIYSDFPEPLSPEIFAIDALENVTSIIKEHDSEAYDSYIELQSPDHINTYREHGRLPGDEPPDPKVGSTPGWRLDKYKFLPMLAHARKTFPDKKWYIYIEDDTYLFLSSLLSWLSTQSYNSKPLYFGAFSGEGNETFAQGGSGLVFSQSLMKSVFEGDKAADLEEYGNYTSTACCGDIALGKVLRDYDIYVNEGDYGPVSFRPEPTWKTGFSDLTWCSPVFTFHHLHQKDIAQLAALERQLHELNASRPILFRDVFTSFVAPHLSQNPHQGWDNFASLLILSSSSPTSEPSIHPSLLTPLSSVAPESTTVNSTTNLTLSRAHEGPSSCSLACLALPGCLTWTHEILREKMEEDGNILAEVRNCALDSSVKLGREMDPLLVWERKRELASGWDMQRIEERLVGNKCEEVGKVVL